MWTKPLWPETFTQGRTEIKMTQYYSSCNNPEVYVVYNIIGKV